jgi:hypothetical protein
LTGANIVRTQEPPKGLELAAFSVELDAETVTIDQLDDVAVVRTGDAP